MTNVSQQAPPQLVARTTAIDLDDDILDRFAPDGFAWLDATGSFVTSGVAACVRPHDAQAFLRALPHERADDAPRGGGPRAVGALPFAGPGDFVVPATIIGADADGHPWCTTIEPSDSAFALHVEPVVPARFAIESLTPRGVWNDGVADALARIERGPLEKVVLARAVQVDADEPFDVRRVLAELHRTQPSCTVYADRGFVGASPELLIRKSGGHVLARPLAGTGTDAARLAQSAKDAREHAFVVEAVEHGLGTRCRDVVTRGPQQLPLADVIHLATTITAEIADADTTVLDLVDALHPTPAVGGSPRGIALETIADLEPLDRGRYAGPCGWIDAEGDGAFVVALRCAAINGARAVLHAGAGIVAGSNAESEWIETQQKLDPMLRVLVRP